MLCVRALLPYMRVYWKLFNTTKELKEINFCLIIWSDFDGFSALHSYYFIDFILCLFPLINLESKIFKMLSFLLSFPLAFPKYSKFNTLIIIHFAFFFRECSMGVFLEYWEYLRDGLSTTTCKEKSGDSDFVLKWSFHSVQIFTITNCCIVTKASWSY